MSSEKQPGSKKLTQEFNEAVKTPVTVTSHLSFWGELVESGHKFVGKVSDYTAFMRKSENKQKGFISEKDFKVGDFDKKLPEALKIAFGLLGAVVAVISFPLAVYDSVKKLLKIIDTDKKLKRKPGVKIKDLDGEVSLAFKIAQFFLGGFRAAVVGVLAFAAVVAFIADAVPLSSLFTASVNYLSSFFSIFVLGVAVAIAFLDLSKSVVKFWNVHQAEKHLKSSLSAANHENPDYSFNTLLKFLRNEDLKEQDHLNSRAFLIPIADEGRSKKAHELKQFLDVRDTYWKLKKVLAKKGIKTSFESLQQFVEDYSDQDKHIELEKKYHIKGKEKFIALEDLRRFAELSLEYHERKESMVLMMGGAEPLKNITNLVEGRKDKLKGNLVSKGIGLLLATVGLGLGVIVALPVVAVIVTTSLILVWSLIDKFAPLPWKKWGKEEKRETPLFISDEGITYALEKAELIPDEIMKVKRSTTEFGEKLDDQLYKIELKEKYEAVMEEAKLQKQGRETHLDPEMEQNNLETLDHQDEGSVEVQTETVRSSSCKETERVFDLETLDGEAKRALLERLEKNAVEDSGEKRVKKTFFV